MVTTITICTLFWVRVRNYILVETNLPVQSLNLDLKTRFSRIIIRNVDGQYTGEPRILEDPMALADNLSGRVYYHPAHGVCITPGSDTRKFPIWVCLQRNNDCHKDHIWVLNLSSFEFIMVPLIHICWVPSHEAANGKFYTIIGSPGRRGYEKEMRLPMAVQNMGRPEQARLDTVPASLRGFTRLQPGRQKHIFDIQCKTWDSIRRGKETIPLDISDSNRLKSLMEARDNSKLPAFCNGDISSEFAEYESLLFPERIDNTHEQITEGFCLCHSDLGPTNFSPSLLHRHLTDDQCSLGSKHGSHCVIAAHRPEICVLGGSERDHEHCVTNDNHCDISNSPPYDSCVQTTHQKTIDSIARGENDVHIDDNARPLLGEPDCTRGARYSHDNDWALDDEGTETRATLDLPEFLLVHPRPINDVANLIPDLQEDLPMPDDLLDINFHIPPIIGPLRERGFPTFRGFSTTPDPSEISPHSPQSYSDGET